MLISFYKPNQPISLFIIPVVIVLLWLPAFFHPLIITTGHDMPLYSFLIEKIGTLPPFLWNLIAATLILLQSIYFNSIIAKNEALYRKTNLPILIYPVCMSLLPEFLSIHPMIFVNTLLLLLLDRTFKLYKNNSALPVIFDIWVILSLCSLFYFPSICLTILLLSSLIILRPFVWREWVVGFLGFAVPYIFITLYYFWNNNLNALVDKLLPNIAFTFRLNFFISPGDLWPAILILALLVLSLIKIQANFYKNVIRTRGYQQVLFGFLIFAGFSIFLPRENNITNLTIVAIPLSFFIAYYFLSSRRAWVSELLFIAVIGLVIYSHLMR